MAENLSKCSCREFGEFDASDDLPKDRNTFRHIVSHGSIQPSHGFSVSNNRCFQVSGYLDTSDQNDIHISERMIALKETADTTGNALTELLMISLEENDLNLNNIVGQGYDGGSNMKGVQSRIKNINKNALYTHCYAHNLNRALINAVNMNRNLKVE